MYQSIWYIWVSMCVFFLWATYSLIHVSVNLVYLGEYVCFLSVDFLPFVCCVGDLWCTWGSVGCPLYALGWPWVSGSVKKKISACCCICFWVLCRVCLSVLWKRGRFFSEEGRYVRYFLVGFYCDGRGGVLTLGE